jgi:branched-chain amino acid transport system ATP-binding protein
MTVLENLQMGAYLRPKADLKEEFERVYTLFPLLYDRRKQLAGTMSGGEQQMLAMGRALMSKPKVLLLDEPSMGLAPVLVDAIFDTIRALHAEGTTILLIEQNARMALQVADRGYVIESGRILLTDSADNLRENEEVRNSYLGIA